MKHPKSYDTTPEVSRRMSRVRLKRGQAETLLAKALWKSVSPALRTSPSPDIGWRSSWTESSGTAMTGPGGRSG